jgi:hypothetical protein
MTGIEIGRVSLSLPCDVPVLPGTGDTEAPIEQRTERCCTDAWWMIGRAMICHEHLVFVLGQAEVDEAIAELLEAGYPATEIPNARERLPWAERHRYAQPDPSRQL